MEVVRQGSPSESIIVDQAEESNEVLESSQIQIEDSNENFHESLPNSIDDLNNESPMSFNPPNPNQVSHPEIRYHQVPMHSNYPSEIQRFDTIRTKEINTIEGVIKRKLSNDRKSFIKKVYSLLLIQLSWTVFVVGIVNGVSVFREGIKATRPLIIASCVICFVIILLIFCKKRVAKRAPYNYIALFSFCFFESYIVSYICAFYEPIVVLCSVLITLSVAFALTFYSCKTSVDFTTWKGIALSITTSLVVSAFLMIFFYEHYASLIFCEIVVIIYSIFIVYDTQLIAGGRYDEIGFDDYIIGSLILFVDIIGLLVYLMMLCFDRT